MSEISGFSFPLNVYARVLELREGQADYLHYGIFDRPDEPVAAAQQRASDLLWQALPPPCRLLEVGIGLGTTLARLRAAGYEACGITPDASQVAAARTRHGGIDAEVARLEDFNRAAGTWQTLLFQESAQYIDPVALFDAADRLLVDGPATLLVMDEFALRRRCADDTGLHDLDAFIALAARRGWRVVQRMDLSQRAAPTLDYLLDGVCTNESRLRGELALGAAELDALNASNRRYRRLYDAGVYGYALLKFERERRPGCRLQWVGSEDSGAMRALFRGVFGNDMSAEHWHWKYGDGRGRAIGLMRDGAMIAHYGGMSRPIAWFGEPALACQIGDVMVDPQATEGLLRHGPMVQVAESFLDSQLGWGRPHRVGFGFPNERAFRVAERSGLYAGVDSIVRLQWPARRGEPSRSVIELAAADLQPGGRYRERAQRLWQQMAAAWRHAVLCVRDASWLLHRYFERPGVRYHVSLLRSRWTRRPLGIVVLRRHEGHVDVLDLIGPPQAFEPLIALARQRAAEWGLERVECWITASQASVLRAIDPAAQTEQPMGITVPANVRTPGPVDELRNRWFLLAGDADFT
ncbi:GNAT family N-acetyltransferase [Aquincola sp. S2]|uniref:GNAT family N-acetyltransferase n=1 Tax=Pseudaquabacterium terrae TaxID=2732868 RepID=A0ABX2EDW9_9BURK|nr:GNAT family N-acetyltransferase [Aquabacterium terrae]NRF66813.1 GNAT family N-acetyltransferase [Aquabacterium terrae]